MRRRRNKGRASAGGSSAPGCDASLRAASGRRRRRWPRSRRRRPGCRWRGSRTTAAGARWRPRRRPRHSCPSSRLRSHKPCITLIHTHSKYTSASHVHSSLYHWPRSIELSLIVQSRLSLNYCCGDRIIILESVKKLNAFSINSLITYISIVIFTSP